MALETHNVLASQLRMVLRWLEANKEDPTDHFSRHGLDVSRVSEPRERFPAGAVEALLIDLRDSFQRPCLGTELAAHHRLNDAHALGITMMASDNGLEALERAIRYQKIMSTAARFELPREGGKVALELHHSAFLNILDVLEPYFFGIIWRWVSIAAPPSLTPLATRLTVAEPANDCLSEALGLPVTWGAKRAAMIFEESALMAPWQMSNTEIVRANEPMLDNLIRGLKSGDVAASVRLQLLDALDEGLPSEDQIAQTLHMSARTLQRRLKAENTTFGEVVQQTRLQLAQQLLASPDITATEVGLACGFADASAFTRAFRRWTGTTPSDYRDKQPADGDSAAGKGG